VASGPTECRTSGSHPYHHHGDMGTGTRWCKRLTSGTKDQGPWTGDHGSGTMDRGSWTGDHGPGIMDRGPWTGDQWLEGRLRNPPQEAEKGENDLLGVKYGVKNIDQ